MTATQTTDTQVDTVFATEQQKQTDVQTTVEVSVEQILRDLSNQVERLKNLQNAIELDFEIKAEEAHDENLFERVKEGLEETYVLIGSFNSNSERGAKILEVANESVFGELICHIVKHDLEKIPTVLSLDLGLIAMRDSKSDVITLAEKIELIQTAKRILPKIVESLEAYKSLIELSGIIRTEHESIDSKFFASFGSISSFTISAYLLSLKGINLEQIIFQQDGRSSVLTFGKNSSFSIRFGDGFSLTKISPEMIFFIHTFVLNSTMQYSSAMKSKKWDENAEVKVGINIEFYSDDSGQYIEIVETGLDNTLDTPANFFDYCSYGYI